MEVIKDGKIIDNYELMGKSSYLFGRNQESCDFVLYHESISRQHALILFDEQENIHIMDLQSANGTFVNGVAIPAHEAVLLYEGNTIQFGQSTRIYYLKIVHHSKRNKKREREENKLEELEEQGKKSKQILPKEEETKNEEGT